MDVYDEVEGNKALFDIIDGEFPNGSDENELASYLFDDRTLGEVMDLASHSASDGWRGLTYTGDLVSTYRKMDEYLWSYYYDEVDEMGEIPMRINKEPIKSHEELCTFLVWFAAESLAQRIRNLWELRKESDRSPGRR